MNSIRTTPTDLAWDADAPLAAVDVLPPPGVAPRPSPAPPWWDTGPPGEPFDFTGHMARLCRDVSRRCLEFAHLNLDRVLITFTQARTGRRHGLQARVTPMRFSGGASVRVVGGVRCRVQRFTVDGRDILYVVCFCLPRFLDQTFEEKFVTVFHELYHIGPLFDGDLRRLGGRTSVHGPDAKAYDAHMAGLARDYLQAGPDERTYSFLRLNFGQLLHRHGAVRALKVPRPKVIPVPHSAAPILRDH